jgi:hypothetical protein
MTVHDANPHTTAAISTTMYSALNQHGVVLKWARDSDDWLPAATGFDM